MAIFDFNLNSSVDKQSTENQLCIVLHPNGNFFFDVEICQCVRTKIMIPNGTDTFEMSRDYIVNATTLP